MKKTMIIFLSAIVFLVIVVKVLTLRNGEEIPQTEATVYSEQAENGSISSVLPGTGTLTDEESVGLEIPSEVEITKWYVSNGDIVAQGEKIAEVDPVSVMTAIVSIQEKMASLDEELQEHEEDTVSDCITAGSGGRVKAVYGEAGDSVIDIMYHHGALMCISLDGLMAVSMETREALSVGETVELTLEDETVINGKVESIKDGKAVITAADDEVGYEEKVSAATEDGEQIGTGQAYIHSELKITGFTGTIESVSATEETSVTEGSTLMTLTDTDYTGEYETLLDKREELESYMQSLFQMYQDQCIYAACDGLISGLEAAEGTEKEKTDMIDQTEHPSEKGPEQMSAAITKTSGMMTTSYVENSKDISDSRIGEDSGAGEPNGENGTGGDNGTGEPNGGNGTGGDNGAGEPNTENGTDGAQGTENGEGTSGEMQGKGSYKTYMGTVTAVSLEGNSVNLQLSCTGFDEPVVLSLQAGTVVTVFSDGRCQTGRADQIQTGQVFMAVYESEKMDTPIFAVLLCEVSEGTGNIPSGAGEDQDITQKEKENITGQVSEPKTGGTGADSLMYDQVMEVFEEEVEADYGVDLTDWLSVIPQEKMEIRITVDEMDILSIQAGQEAEVTVNALKGQTFSGEVTAVNLNGTNSGGSSKYEAVITLDRSDDMLSGMNVSVQILLETKENILVIPENALTETDTGVYVYTTYDEKSDTLGGLTEVTTGVSDGTYVEILSGLTEGSTYWYRCLDVVNYDKAALNKGSFSMKSIFGGGRP